MIKTDSQICHGRSPLYYSAFFWLIKAVFLTVTVTVMKYLRRYLEMQKVQAVQNQAAG
ncbi:MAG: hypothetical protein HC886_13210 [Leptolyngbyaceae cyanobacterium SM1_1_3]|nr:hypothetical protein [Leptolyngbyaceae cyanobacterium SM1_1_3]NJN02981.1 hypothetical protein [Leptolyngbyaceae cyanobacterium RM1_1_2]NJO10745.1 hypothetical protein [Leptolyngbyaceae cyanobacterium SL_1_1]